MEYEDDKPVRVDTVVISTQHSPDVDQQTIYIMMCWNRLLKK